MPHHDYDKHAFVKEVLDEIDALVKSKFGPEAQWLIHMVSDKCKEMLGGEETCITIGCVYDEANVLKIMESAAREYVNAPKPDVPKMAGAWATEFCREKAKASAAEVTALMKKKHGEALTMESLIDGIALTVKAADHASTMIDFIQQKDIDFDKVITKEEFDALVAEWENLP